MSQVSIGSGQTGQAEERPSDEANAGSERCSRRLFVERLLPNADVVESRHVVVNATPAATWEALKSANFLQVGSPLTRALVTLRVLAVQIARFRLGLAPLRRPVRLSLDNVEEYGQMKLAEEPGVEIVIGAIARPFRPESLFERRSAAEFTRFDCPGYMKGAGGFVVEPYGERRTLLTYEARVRATDTSTRRQLILWTTLAAPLLRAATRSTLAFIKRAAEARCAAPRRARAL